MAISSAESIVMETVWRRSPLSAEEIFAEVGESQGWALQTLKTLLGRLVEKKALAATKDGRRFLYRPLIAREDYVANESQNLVDRLFGGRLAPLVAHFSEREALSPEDIKELKQLIGRLDNGRR
ncbi:MAG: BlaI/MecI/CopY family transcriptional regulator [Burkholderiales bacterium]|nr:MAG: BlaI/MecI/CopY family transcriptional regulator [Burkholderiales bacterium]